MEELIMDSLFSVKDSQDEFRQRLQETRADLRQSYPISKSSLFTDVRFVRFRQDEVLFLLYWYHEYYKWCCSHKEWGKGCGHCPACRVIRESLPSLDCGHFLVELCLALFDELAVDQGKALAMPLEEVCPPIPWKTIEEYNARQGDVDAYKIRKEKADSVSGSKWRRMSLDFSQQERAFLDAWLQERLHRQPGSAHDEQTSRGV